MALMPEDGQPRDDVSGRFLIAQDKAPTKEQLEEQAEVRRLFVNLASEINYNVADSREKSLALTKLEEALMWAGKAIFA